MAIPWSDFVAWLRADAGVPHRVIYETATDEIALTGIAEPQDARRGDLSWVSTRREGLAAWHGSVLLTDIAGFPETGFPPHGHVVAHSPAPRLLIARAIERFFPGLAARCTIDAADGVVLHPTAVVGAPGFGWIWSGERFERFPHVGNVVLGDGVEIAHGARVQRGAIGDTVIGDGTKIGPGANVGHGCRVGRHCLLATGCSLAGGVELGDRVTVWQGAMVAHGVRIGARAVIGMGAVVLHDVPADETWAGNPAHKLER